MDPMKEMVEQQMAFLRWIFWKAWNMNDEELSGMSGVRLNLTYNIAHKTHIINFF